MEDTPATHNDDSESDVSMSTDSEDEDDNHSNLVSEPTAPFIHDLIKPATVEADEPVKEASKKRKYSGLSETPMGGLQDITVHEIRKRLKPDESLQSHWTSEGHLCKDKSLLPPEIWHHIFTFCPPRVLGLLLQVNRTFNAYLDTSSLDHSPKPLSRSVLQILTQDSIWRASRHLHFQGTPAPLAGKTELDMWKLACGTLCQFCGKKRQTNSNISTDLWHPGPGENGVVTVWSFGIRACGSCLQSRSTKVGDLSSQFLALVTSNSNIGNRFTPVVLYSFPSDDSSAIYISHQ